MVSPEETVDLSLHRAEIYSITFHNPKLGAREGLMQQFETYGRSARTEAIKSAVQLAELFPEVYINGQRIRW